MSNNLLEDKNILYLSDGTKITLNKQQLDAITFISQFIKSTSKFFVLSGHAGTGKTTVIKKILDNYNGNSVVSAPTNKALQVISQATMIDGVTIHSLLGLQPDIGLEDFNPNEPQFNQIKPAIIKDYNLIIIDEASMINNSLFELIKAEIDNLSRVKIIFMGDKAQLPPISEDRSIIFALDTIYHYELTELVRQSQQNPLIEIYNDLRNNTDNEAYEFNYKSNLNSADEGFIVAKTKDEFRDRLTQIFTSKEYKNDLNYAKLVAWRNKTVNQSNKIIRNIIYSDNAKIIQKSDILTGYRTIKGTKAIPYYINNCVDYKVSAVSRRQKNKYGIYGYTVKMLEKSKIYKGFDEKKVFIVDYEDLDNLYDYAEMHDTLVDIARADKKKWNAYYLFRRDNLMMINISKYRDNSLRDKKKQISKDLDYGYAVTCHKAQGSTYEHIFILAKDISLNHNVKERNQMLYVALTRPRKSAIIL